MQERSLTTLRIFFDDDEEPEILVPIPLHEGQFYSLGEEHEVTLPDAHKLSVYAEVSCHEAPDVSLSIIEGSKSVDVRCCGGLVVRYTTTKGRDVLFQIGSGAWE